MYSAFHCTGCISPHATAEECFCARRRVKLVPCPSTPPPRLKVTPPHPDPRLDTPCAKSPAGVKQGHPKDLIALCVAVGMILCLFVFIDGLLFLFFVFLITSLSFGQPWPWHSVGGQECSRLAAWFRLCASGTCQRCTTT